MPTNSYYKGIGHVVYVSTTIETGCEHCVSRIGGEQFSESVNHYIKAHSYKLLHVGQESSHADEGSLWHSTVAVLGK